MKFNFPRFLILLSVIFLLASCNALDKASIHGLNSGYYTLKSDSKDLQHVYLDVTDEKIDVYQLAERRPAKQQFLTIPLVPIDSILFKLPISFNFPPAIKS